MQKSITKLALSTLTALAIAVAPIASASAQTLSLTDTDSPFAPFGKPATATYGQTFVAPTSFNTIQSFSFWLSNDAGLGTNPGALSFKAYLMRWDAVAQHATGPVLYTSTVRGGPTIASQRYDFNTGGVALLSNTQYVAFMSVSGMFNSIGQSTATATVEGSTAGTYTGGQLVFTDNGDSFSALTTTAWDFAVGFPEFQTHFNATFSNTSVVPEPSSLVLLASSGLVLLVAARRRKRA